MVLLAINAIHRIIIIIISAHRHNQVELIAYHKFAMLALQDAQHALVILIVQLALIQMITYILDYVKRFDQIGHIVMEVKFVQHVNHPIVTFVHMI